MLGEDCASGRRGLVSELRIDPAFERRVAEREVPL